MKTAVAFHRTRIVAAGPLSLVALAVKEYLTQHPEAPVLIFDDQSGREVDLDLRGSEDDILRRYPAQYEQPESAVDKKAGPGRPRLGVVAKEVTLLPQHWEWLGQQPGGASVTLRKMVDEAKKKNFGRDQIRQAQEATYRFMTTMAGDLPYYEEALRALYAKDATKFSLLIKDWPKDIRWHVEKLAGPALPVDLAK